MIAINRNNESMEKWMNAATGDHGVHIIIGTTVLLTCQLI